MREMKDSGVEWIGEIPADWKICCIKNITTKIGSGVTPSGGATVYSDEGIMFLRSQNIYNNGLSLENVSFISEEIDNIMQNSRVRYEDVLLNITGGSIGRCCIFDVEDCHANVNQHVCILRTEHQKMLPQYLRYFWNSTAGDEIVDYCQTGGNRQGLNFQQIGNTRIPLCNLEEQKMIVENLDKKCEQIELLLSNVQSQMEKLKAYKQSLIAEVVTRGLDPTVPMKESGVEWLGNIPAHWSVTRIKNCFELRNERNYLPLEEVNLISLYTEQGVVQHSDIIETTGNRAVTADGYKKVYKRDIVVNIILCWMGAVGMSKYDGVTSPAYDIYKPLEGTFSEYYHYLFRTKRFNGECYRYGRGIMMMRWRTYSTEFRSIVIPEPPMDEQRKIVDYLDQKCAQIDRLISIKQAKIDKLNRYKKSLIYEYVTGKREVL